jgi:GT2 family glycosyltransferase
MLRDNRFNQPIISIIIPCHNAEKFIDKCLNSVLDSLLPQFEAIVIDDASSDKSTDILKLYKRHKKIKVYYLDQNRGPSYIRNLGVKKSKGKYILFLDIDCLLDKNALVATVQKFDTDEKVGALQLKLINNRIKKIESVGHFLTIFGLPYELGTGGDSGLFNGEMPIFGAKTAGMAVRKKVFQRIGGFDEDYFIYGEDTDLSWRVWLAGYQVNYLPKAIVYHHQQSSLNKETNFRIFYEGAKNNTANILKNASLPMIFWMLPLHIFTWILISFKLILEKRFSFALWIYRGILWNGINIMSTVRKSQLRKLYLVNNRIQNIMFGPLEFRALTKKAWRWFLNA